jgi:acyl-CoA thioesterase YciA
MASRPTSPPEPAIRVVMMPRDTNAVGTIFGGVLLSYIDQAAFIGAREVAAHRYVTVAMNAVEFKEPVFVGDVLSFYAEPVKMGRTSIRVRITVWAERFASPGPRIRVTEAEVVLVAVDENRQAIPITPKADAQ